jgi:hypothetical protein
LYRGIGDREIAQNQAEEFDEREREEVWGDGGCLTERRCCDWRRRRRWRAAATLRAPAPAAAAPSRNLAMPVALRAPSLLWLLLSCASYSNKQKSRRTNSRLQAMNGQIATKFFETGMFCCCVPGFGKGKIATCDCLVVMTNLLV